MSKKRQLCRANGCSRISEPGSSYCIRHKDNFYQKQYNAMRWEVSPKERMFYNSKEWKKLRKLVLLEEGCCRQCGSYGGIEGKLDVHHIVPVKEDWDKRLNRDNLCVLCRGCHFKIENNPHLLKHNPATQMTRLIDFSKLKGNIEGNN